MAGTVTVSCKLPNGLILRAFEMVKQNEPVLGGGTREVSFAREIGSPVRVHGSAAPFGSIPIAPVQGGYAMTSGVDADFWAAWLDQNKDSDVVKNNLIFASERQDTAQKKSTEQAEVKSGLEALDPEKPMRGIQRAKRPA